MIKFIHKKHLHGEHHSKGKIIIYYNGLDIFLGTLLMALVVFFVHDYLSHSLYPSGVDFAQTYTTRMMNPYHNTSPIKNLKK